MSSLYPMLPGGAPTPNMPFSFFPPPAPTYMPSVGGIGSLAGNGANGVLGRASALASQVPSHLPGAPRYIPRGGGFPAGLLPGGAGAEATAAANALRGGGASATGAASRGGASLASRLMPSLPSAAEGGAGGLLTRTAGFAGRHPGIAGLGYNLAGAAGSYAFDKLTPGSHNSNIEQFLQGASLGAGAGAAAGAPFAGIGALPGALAGAAVGGAIGILGNTFGWGGGDDDKKEIVPEDVIANAIMVGQLDEATSNEIMVGYDTLMALAEQYEEGSDERKAAEESALDEVGQMVLSAVGQRDAISSDASNMLALQSQARDIFEPIAQDIEGSAAMYGSAMQGIRGSLPESMRGIADYQTAQGLSSGNRLANAYRAQAAITPMVDRMTQYQQDFNSYAAQQFAQAMAQQAAGQSSSLGPSQQDVSALLAATG